ncbi:PE family protein [Mycobacterium sp.]|uniref:PE family protein n=1 Tax=Mycobacterium sp. TaxID=1785 RepID=UPI003F97EB2E
MTSLLTQPELLTTAAADAQQINSAIGQARAAAAGPTTSVVAAAEDEISALTAQLFGSYGQEYQAALQQAGLFHESFVATLSAAGNAYAGAEFAASSLLGTVEADAQGLLGGGTLPNAAANIGLFMGGSGLPVPPPSYVTAVGNWVALNFPGVNGQALFTPEGLYPLTGVKSLPLNISVSQGVSILESAINQQILLQNNVSVLGYSQSAIISSLVMRDLLSGAYPYTVPTTSQLNFTLLGDPMAPNGGLFERFAGLTLPSLGLDFYGATPPNTPYATNIYTLQYDGYADFPRYPINFLSDLNAFAGIYYVHGTYPSINPSALPPGDTMITLPGSMTLTGSGATNYYMITQPNLPLLDPLRAIPVIGNPLADLVQPDLTYLVNWGYGNPLYGYSTGPANVPTPFGVFPPLSATTALPGLLASGAQQGATAFVGDISHMGTPSLPSLSLGSGGGASIGGLSLPTQLPSIPTPDSIIESLQTANTTATDFVTNAVAQSYAVLLPTADIANALLTSMPSYDVNLFLSGIEQAVGGDPTGGLIYAFGAPLAADTALLTLAGGFEVEVIANAVTSII